MAGFCSIKGWIFLLLGEMSDGVVDCQKWWDAQVTAPLKRKPQVASDHLNALVRSFTAALPDASTAMKTALGWGWPRRG